MRYLFPVVTAVAALSGTAAANALAFHPSSGTLYVRARAAEVAGDSGTANAEFARLLTLEPANRLFAAHAYRQAIAAGDLDLALRAAHLLENGPEMPADARILIAIEQVRARNWTKARQAADRLSEDRLFGFLGPYFQAWIAVGSGSGDALALLDSGSNLPFAAPYRDEQRALLLVALGRGKEAALAQPSLALPARIDAPEQGLAPLFVHVAADFAHQRMTPIGLIMARMATYAAPGSAPGWLLAADFLRTMQRPDLALGALDHVRRDDPLAQGASAMRIGLLNDSGRADGALREALAATGRTGAVAEDWGRLGDLYQAMERPRDAARAYAQAVSVAVQAHAAPDTVWPLLLQQGGALDQAGDWAAARAALDRAYALAPDQPIVLNQVGYSQIEHHENVDRAGSMIERASKLRPEDPAITDSLGWVSYLRGHAAEAVPLLERASAADPGEATINEHLGDVYWAIGRRYEARFAWRAALVTAAEKDRPRLTAKIDGTPPGLTVQP